MAYCPFFLQFTLLIVHVDLMQGAVATLAWGIRRQASAIGSLSFAAPTSLHGSGSGYFVAGGIFQCAYVNLQRHIIRQPTLKWAQIRKLPPCIGGALWWVVSARGQSIAFSALSSTKPFTFSPAVQKQAWHCTFEIYIPQYSWERLVGGKPYWSSDVQLLIAHLIQYNVLRLPWTSFST